MDNEQLTQEPQYLVLTNESGENVEYEVILAFTVEEGGQEYLAIVPTDEGDDEVHIYGFEDRDTEVVLRNIEDDAEWELVERTFNEILLAGEEA